MAMIKLMLVFVFLQLADLGTTAAVLLLGGSEQNPIVQHLMGFGSLEGLILAKVLAVAIGIGCFAAAKYRALRMANWAFTVIVAWNLIAIAVLV